METKICIFKENPITFALDKNNGMMVNATEMAKAFDRDLYQFTKSEDTKKFIEACQKPANAGLLGIVNESDLIISRQKSGTYMHRVLAIKFAAWLNPDFEIWVYSTIERILFGKHAQREASKYFLHIWMLIKNMLLASHNCVIRKQSDSGWFRLAHDMRSCIYSDGSKR